MVLTHPKLSLLQRAIYKAQKQNDARYIGAGNIASYICRGCKEKFYHGAAIEGYKTEPQYSSVAGRSLTFCHNCWHKRKLHLVKCRICTLIRAMIKPVKKMKKIVEEPEEEFRYTPPKKKAFTVKRKKF